MMLCGRKRSAAFQSTLPARGATFSGWGTLVGMGYFNPRSPHGERLASFQRFVCISHFNPRSPHGERLFFVPFGARI